MNKKSRIQETFYVNAILLGLVIFLLSGIASAQWVTTDGGEYGDEAMSIQQTTDGGYSTAGGTPSITIRVSASPRAGGFIRPHGKAGSGRFKAVYGQDLQFTITPRRGYQIKDVIVDGVSQGSVNTYTFTNITQKHSIKAKFAIQKFTVMIAQGGNVSVSPVGIKKVTYGKKIKLKITPNSEDTVPILLVNGQPVDVVKSGTIYKFAFRVFGDTSVYATSAVEPTLTPNAKVIDEATVQSLSSISEDGSLLSFNGITPFLESLQPGDVIIIGVTEATPYGLLRKVTNITIDGSQITVEATGATLEDVIEEGEIIINKTLTASDITSFVPLMEGVTLEEQEIPGPLVGGKQCVSLHQVLWDADDDLNTTTDQATFNGNACISTDVKFAAGIGVGWCDCGLLCEYPCPKLKNFTFSAKFGESLAYSLECRYDYSYKKEVPIAEFYFGAITIGPVVFIPKLIISAGIDAALLAGITFGVSQSSDLTLGLAYDGSNFTPISGYTINFNAALLPEYYANASATAYVRPELDLLLYGVAGFYADAKGYLGLELAPFGNPWLSLYAGIQAGAGVKGEILGFGIEKGFTLFDYRKALLELYGNAPPMITSLTAYPTLVPTGGTSRVQVSGIADPEHDPFTCSWSTDGGTLSSTTGCLPVTWTAPLTPGTYTVSVSVADNKEGHSPNKKGVAIAVLQGYTLTVENSGDGSGTVTGTGVDCGGDVRGIDCSESFLGVRTVTLVATPSRGSAFANWSGCNSSNGHICTVTLDQNKTVSATFAAQYYMLSVEKSGSGRGTVTGTGIDCGTDCSESLTGRVTLTATPRSDSEIWNWTGCDSITGDTWNICTVFMDGNKTVTARFSARYTLSVQKAGDGSGTVTGIGIDCGTDCSEHFLAESPPGSTTLVLTANPSSDSALANWSGCDSTNGNTCTVTVGSNKTVTATFAARYTLSVNYAGSGWGSSTSSPQGKDCGDGSYNCYYSGTTVTLTATPSSSSSFTNWSGCDSTNGNTCTVNINQNKIVTATFTLEYNTLSVQKAGTGSGTVTGTGINCGSDCSETVVRGTTLTLTATPSNGSTLTSWSGCDSTNGNTCTISVDSNKTVTATFTLNVPQYKLSVQKAGSGDGTVTGGGINCGSNCSLNLAGGTTVTLTATPSTSSSFTNWSGCDSTNVNICTVTMNQNKTVTATFTLAYNTLSIQKGGCGSGTVTGGGINCGSDCSETLVKGTTVTLTGTPDSGSVFVGFYNGTYRWYPENTRTVLRNESDTALFGLQAYNLCVQPTGSGSGVVNGQVFGYSYYECYLYGDGTVGGTCASNWPTSGHYYTTLYAQPYQGSRFDGWTGPCNRTGQNSSGYWCETIWIGQDGWPFEAFVATFTKN